MRNWWALLASLAGAILLAVIGTTPPAPRGAGAPAAAFSAERAMADVRAIGRAPHPTGSAENARVRAYLAERLRGLGLQVRLSESALPASGVAKLARWRGAVGDVPVATSIVGELAGTDPALPAVLLMAHYDSVWGSPGAADDAAGVAAVLETVRAVTAGGPPRRGIVVLLSDGEELGLVGARAFFAADPLRASVGVVLNLEARGGGGRTSMFETGQGNGAMMALFANAVARPAATSLSVFVYEHLPNSTDFTPAKDAGYPGFNFAFIGRSGLYHSPLATPDALDQGSVQDMGAQVLDLTRALIAAPVLPGKAADLTFFDAFGFGTVHYAPAMGWLLLALAAGGYGVAAWRRASRRDVVVGPGATLALGVVASVLLYLFNLLSGAGPTENYYDRLAAIPRLEAQALLVCLAAAVAAWGLIGRAGVGLAAGMALPVLALGAVAQWAAPTASYPIVVPLLLGGLALAVARVSDAAGRIAIAAAAMLGFGYMIAFGYQLIQAIGPDTPMAVALPLMIAAVLLVPLAPIVARRWALVAAGVLLVLAAGVALWVRLDAMAPSVAVYSNDK